MTNLKFAGKSVTDDAMREAAAIAQATGFIEEREGGFGLPAPSQGVREHLRRTAPAHFPSRVPSPSAPRSWSLTTSSSALD